MSRRSKAQRTLTEPDPIYNSRLVTLLVSRILKSGKKSLAQRIVYNALEIISTKTEEKNSGIIWSSLKYIKLNFAKCRFVEKLEMFDELYVIQ